MTVLHDAHLRVRDALYQGLIIREGEVLTEALARERAANLCYAVIETIREGLIIEMEARKASEPKSRYGFEQRNPGDVLDEPPIRFDKERP